MEPSPEPLVDSPTAQGDDPPVNPPAEEEKPAPAKAKPFPFPVFWKQIRTQARSTVSDLPENALKAAFDTHDAFLKGGGTPARPGEHLDFSYKKLPRPDALLNLDLRSANLRGADLAGHAFGWANVKNADFTDADLTDADLSLVTNLQFHQLSGADLTRCKLPADIAAFPVLANVATLSQNAGKLFSTMIGAVIFVLLIAFTTSDLQVLAASGKAKLPVIDVEVSTTTFLIVSPFVLFVLYLLVHLYLQRLWGMMAQLPAIFPDGVTVDAKTYPWLVNDRIRLGFPRLKRYPTPLSWLHVVTFGTIADATVPFALLLVYLRCLIRHDWLMTGFQVGILSICTGSWAMFGGLNRVVLSRNKRILTLQGTWRKSWFGIAGTLIGLAVAGTSALTFCAFADRAFYGVPQLEYTEDLTETAKNLLKARERGQLTDTERQRTVTRWGYTQIPYLLLWLRQTSYGNLPEERSLRPEKWTDPLTALAESMTKTKPLTERQNRALVAKDILFDQVDAMAKPNLKVVAGLRDLAQRRVQEHNQKIDLQVRPINLRGMHLNFLNAPSAFLVNADLRGSQLQFANLRGADLRAALFRDEKKSINFTGANLSGATLTGADLSGATLTGANLSWATLTDANLRRATLTGANLRRATLTDADLSGATLTDADLSGADLRKVKNLDQCNLDQAVFTILLGDEKKDKDWKATQWPDGKVPSRWVEKDFDGKITASGTYKTAFLTEQELKKFIPRDDSYAKAQRAEQRLHLRKLVRVPDSPKKSR